MLPRLRLRPRVINPTKDAVPAGSLDLESHSDTAFGVRSTVRFYRVAPDGLPVPTYASLRDAPRGSLSPRPTYGGSGTCRGPSGQYTIPLRWHHAGPSTSEGA